MKFDDVTEAIPDTDATRSAPPELLEEHESKRQPVMFTSVAGDSANPLHTNGAAEMAPPPPTDEQSVNLALRTVIAHPTAWIAPPIPSLCAL